MNVTPEECAHEMLEVVPLVMRTSFRMSYQGTEFVGGTGLSIVIGVLLDTLKQIESQLLMRHYEGFAMRRLIRRGVPFRTPTYEMGDHMIWGATARILSDLLARLAG